MSVASRQSKPRKESNPPQSNTQRRPPAWRNNNNSSNNNPPFNPNHSTGGPGPNHRTNNANATHNNAGNFPPLQSGAQDRMALLLSNHTGTTVIISTRNGRFEGMLNPPEQEGTGVILKDCKDLSNPANGIKPSHFISSQFITSWQAAEVPSANVPKTNGDWDTFRTDTEISGSANVRRDRDLQAWKPDATVPNTSLSGDSKGDETTFGTGANKSWDQFAENERLFGVTTNYDEDLYTTKLDRTAADYKERERKAQQIANEIMGTTSSNPHIAEERNLVDDSGVNEEDRYGAVVRGPGAYIPPAARKGMNGSALPAKIIATQPPAQPAAAAQPSVEVPKLAVQGPDGAAKASPGASPSLPNAAAAAASTAKGAVPAGDNNLVGSFRDFVTNERQRLAQKKQAIVKSEMDKRMQDLIKFSQSFKLNKPIPEDLVPILTKDEEKQKAIVKKSAADAESGGARSIGFSPPVATNASSAVKPGPTTPQLKDNVPAARKPAAPANPAAAAPGTLKTAASKPGAKGVGGMFIQAIPPFNPEKRRAVLSASVSAPGMVVDAGRDSNASPAAMPSSPTNSVTSSTSAAFKLNVNASTFKPSPTAPPFKPGASPSSPGLKPSSSVNSTVASPKVFSSPMPKTSENPPSNPFFGAKVIKKTAVVHIKDDFNPFKFAKVAEASAVSAIWQYNGKRYQYMFSMVPHNAPPAPPPPSYEEDTAAQAARAGGYGMMYAYPAPYQYPGQPPQQPMMAVPTTAPPGGYVPPHFMQPMQYPAPPPGAPPTMYAPPQMATMPPGQGYLPPAPYPPQNGAPRGSMPPAPMPPHAYYHQSPQMAHAVPYPMMMQPPAAAAPYPYDAQQGPPGAGPMGVGQH